MRCPRLCRPTGALEVGDGARPELQGAQDVESYRQDREREDPPVYAYIVQHQQKKGEGVAIEQVAGAKLYPPGRMEQQHRDHHESNGDPERRPHRAEAAIAPEEIQEERRRKEDADRYPIIEHVEYGMPIKGAGESHAREREEIRDDIRWNVADTKRAIFDHRIVLLDQDVISSCERRAKDRHVACYVEYHDHRRNGERWNEPAPGHLSPVRRALPERPGKAPQQMLRASVLPGKVVEEGKTERHRGPAEEGASQEDRAPGEVAAERHKEREQHERETQDVRREPHAPTEREIEVDRAKVERYAEDDVLDPGAARQPVGSHL